MNWTIFLSVLGACAWIPIIVIPFYKYSKKIRFKLLDYQILTDAKSKRSFCDEVYEGTILLLCLNLYNPGYDFFAAKTLVKVYTDNNTFNALPLEYSNTICKENNNEYCFEIKEEQDFGKDMLIINNCKNIKFIAVFIPDSNISSEVFIKRIDIKFEENFFRKKHIKINKDDFPEIFSEGMINKTKKRK